MTSYKHEKQDKLDILITLAMRDITNEQLTAFLNADTSNVVFSKRYYRKKAAFINRYNRRPQIAMFKRIVSSVAVTVLAVMSAAFLMIMSISALREAVFKVVIEWYDSYISIHYEQPAETTDTYEETNAESSGVGVTTEAVDTQPPETSFVQPPSKILEFRKPRYLPEGVEEEIVIESSKMNMVDYYIGDELQYTYRQRIITDANMGFDNAGLIISSKFINGNEAIVLQNEGGDELTLIWNDSEYIYQIISYLKLEETLLIAESIG